MDVDQIGHTWQSQVIFGLLALWYAWRLFRIIRGRIVYARKRKSFELYKETGREDKTFRTLSGAGAEAAGRAHGAVVSRRILGRSNFTACGPCPKCGWIDFHALRRRDHCPEDRTVYRTCMICQIEWMES